MLSLEEYLVDQHTGVAHLVYQPVPALPAGSSIFRWCQHIPRSYLWDFFVGYMGKYGEIIVHNTKYSPNFEYASTFEPICYGRMFVHENLFIFYPESWGRWPKNWRTYCWWLKSCTSWYGKYPTIYKVLYIRSGAGFLPSTVVIRLGKKMWETSVQFLNLDFPLILWIFQVGSFRKANLYMTSVRRKTCFFSRSGKHGNIHDPIFQEVGGWWSMKVHGNSKYQYCL